MGNANQPKLTAGRSIAWLDGWVECILIGEPLEDSERIPPKKSHDRNREQKGNYRGPDQALPLRCVSECLKCDYSECNEKYWKSDIEERPCNRIWDINPDSNVFRIVKVRTRPMPKAQTSGNPGEQKNADEKERKSERVCSNRSDHLTRTR